MVALGSLYGPEASGYPRPNPYDTHLSVAVIVREGEDGLEYLVFEYDSGEGVQIKFPAGTNKGWPGERPDQTLAREVREETGLIIPSNPRWFWSGPRTENRKMEDGPGYHQKIAFLIPFDDCKRRGEMRTLPMIDEGGTRLSPPFWRTAGELLIPVEKGGLFYTHRPILEEARKKYLS